MDVVHTIALAMGVAWASGLNLYAAVGMLGIMGTTGAIELPPEMAVVEHPAVIGAAVLMYCIEFFADKVPGLDTTWDAIHSFIRVPAGAVLASQAVGTVDPALELAALLVGGTVALGAHATKAGTRAVINTSPEPVSNWTASVTEDVAVVGGLYAAMFHPIVFFAIFGAFVLFAAWALPRIWRGLKRIAAVVAGWFGHAPAATAQAAPAGGAVIDVEAEPVPPRQLGG